MTVSDDGEVAAPTGREAGVVERVSAGLAIAGGLLMLALAVLVTASVLLRWLAGQAIPGDFELVQMGLSVAVFAFLPLCQWHGGNIFVDTFTTRAPAWFRAALDGLWALVYAVLAALIAWRLAVGASEAFSSGTNSMVLGLPTGWAIAVASLLTAWLAFVALATAARAIGKSRR